MKMHRVSAVFAIAAVCVGAAACGSDSDSNSGSGGSAAPSAGAEASGPPIDACALLGDADIAPLIGTSVPGKSTSTRADTPSCMWENPDTYTSVTVEIGSPDTAINGTLPPADPAFQTRPAPDGMRYSATGVVDFAADRRSNSVQVANLSSAPESDAAALALAQKVKAKMPS